MDDRLNIQVGERHFVTRRSTLADRTKYFRAVFSGEWADVPDTETYFLDADGDAFAHVLRYCRHGTLPLLYDAATDSHDYAMYGVILEQAKMLGIDPLQEYLQDKRYLDAMQTEYIKVSKRTGFGHRIPDGAGMYKKVPLVNFGPSGDPDTQSVRKVNEEPVYMRTVYNHSVCQGNIDAALPKKLGKKKEVKKRKQTEVEGEN